MRPSVNTLPEFRATKGFLYRIHCPANRGTKRSEIWTFETLWKPKNRGNLALGSNAPGPHFETVRSKILLVKRSINNHPHLRCDSLAQGFRAGFALNLGA